MHIYQNGERCPCCGEVLRDKTAEWLELFSCACELLGLSRRAGRRLSRNGRRKTRTTDAILSDILLRHHGREDLLQLLSFCEGLRQALPQSPEPLRARGHQTEGEDI